MSEPLSKAFNRAVAKSHNEFVLEQKGEATAETWKAFFRVDFNENPEKYMVDKEALMDSLLDAKANAEWRKKPSETPLFAIAGIALDEHYIYPGEDKGVFNKVHCSQCTVGQFEKSAYYKLRKSAEANSAALRDVELSEEVKRRADGDPMTRIVDVAD